MLADPEFANKAREGRADEINVCIACNQACLDFIFSKRVATCLVNPKAGREIEFDVPAPAKRKRIAVVGAGPAGLACAVTAAERGHAVTLYEARGAHRRPAQPRAQRAGQGGVRRDAALLPAPHRPARHRSATGVAPAMRDALASRGFDEIVIATGVTPRTPAIPGIDHASGARATSRSSTARRTAGRRVAVLGAGGIGFDIAEFLTSPPQEVAAEPAHFQAEWGVDAEHRRPRWARPQLGRERQWREARAPGGDAAAQGRPHGPRARRQHRLGAAAAARQAQGGADDGRHLRAGSTTTACTSRWKASERVVPADTIVICAGQEPERALYDELIAARRARPTSSAGRSAPPSSTRCAPSTRARGWPTRSERSLSPSSFTIGERVGVRGSHGRGASFCPSP